MTYHVRRYTARRVKTRELQLNDLVYFVGAGMPCPIIAIKWDDTEDVYLTVEYEAHGRRRKGTIHRRFNGVTTIHVPVEPVGVNPS